MHAAFPKITPLQRSATAGGMARPFCRAVIVFLCGCAVVLLSGCGQRQTRWTMINVSPAEQQADCHLLEFADGRKVLIDAADAGDAPGTAVSYLKKHKVRSLDLVVLTHFHQDHYGRLIDIIKAGIRVDRVAINLPGSREIADVERPWGCDWDDVQALLRFLTERGIPFFTPKEGERLLEVQRDGVVTALDVVCLYDGVSTPVGRTDMNDTSIILRLTHGSTRVLFTGDLNQRLGAWLATGPFDVKADLLKVPHHGTEGLAPNEFFDKVGAKAVLVPAPKTLWLSDRSKRVRDYFAERKVPAYVSGIHGSVTVELTGQGYTIRQERK